MSGRTFEREISLIGEEAFAKLCGSTVLICGVGGVGSAVSEGIARAGVGKIILADCDSVDETNINRQLIATVDTVGMRKVESAKKRIKSINPDCEVVLKDVFLTKENIPELLREEKIDFVADAIDNVSAKIALACGCEALGIPLIASMGTGNKLYPEMLEITDIYKTSVCPLARVMRTELKKRNVKRLTVVYSKEQPVKVSARGSRTPSSISFVPPCAGFMMAGYIVRKIAGLE